MLKGDGLGPMIFAFDLHPCMGLTTVSVTGINQVSINKMWFAPNIFKVGHQKMLVKGHAVHVP